MWEFFEKLKLKLLRKWKYIEWFLHPHIFLWKLYPLSICVCVCDVNMNSTFMCHFVQVFLLFHAQQIFLLKLLFSIKNRTKQLNSTDVFRLHRIYKKYLKNYGRCEKHSHIKNRKGRYTHHQHGTHRHQSNDRVYAKNFEIQ